MSSPNLFGKRASMGSPGSAAKRYKGKVNNIMCVHVKPREGTDKSLELLVFHAENGNYSERLLTWPFYNQGQTDPVFKKAALDMLDTLGFHPFAHKMSDGNGRSMVNPQGYDIKASVKPIEDAALGVIDGPAVNGWVQDISLGRGVAFF
jgi:hypothetical protein